MVEKNIKIKGDVLRAKKAGEFVEMVSNFSSSVYLEMGNKRVNAKSIIGVLSMNLNDGDTVCVLAGGSDEEKAAAAVEEYLA